MTIEKERATVLYGAASVFIILISSPLIAKYDLSSLKTVWAKMRLYVYNSDWNTAENMGDRV